VKRFVFVALVIAVVLTALPAWAHEEINPATFTSGKPTFFTLTAANEEKADIVKVTLAPPKTFGLGGTSQEPSGWSVSTSEAAITWTAATGSGIKPDHIGTWTFESEGVDQPGVLTMKVTLGFSDGKSDDVQVLITATAPGTATTPTSVAASPTTPTTSSAAPATPPSAKAKTETSGTAKAALAVGIVAAVLALLGLAAGMRATRGARERPKQDW
jgi:hypothetical protein